MSDTWSFSGGGESWLLCTATTYGVPSISPVSVQEPFLYKDHCTSLHCTVMCTALDSYGLLVPDKLWKVQMVTHGRREGLKNNNR